MIITQASAMNDLTKKLGENLVDMVKEEKHRSVTRIQAKSSRSKKTQRSSATDNSKAES